MCFFTGEICTVSLLLLLLTMNQDNRELPTFLSGSSHEETVSFLVTVDNEGGEMVQISFLTPVF